MLEYEIHSVEESQLSDCLKTLHAAFGESAKIYGYTRETYPSSGAVITLQDLAEAKKRGVHMYAAYVDGIVAGYVQLEKLEAGAYAFRRFAVLPQYQKLGIGRALVSHCRARAELYGGKKLTSCANRLGFWENGEFQSGFFVHTENKEVFLAKHEDYLDEKRKQLVGIEVVLLRII